MRRDRGVILVNVLVALALGSALVVLMFTSQDTLIDRSRRAAAASQATALALGGEASVMVALRRDMIAAPDTDNYAEPWAAIAQEEVDLPTGRFSVAIADAQARFDVNRLADGAVVPARTFALLIEQAGLPTQVGQRIAAQVRSDERIASLDDLRDLDTATRAALETILVALPVPGDVNLNTAPLAVLSAVLGNTSAATRLLALRDRQGFVGPEDLMRLDIVASTGVGLTSDVFDVTVQAEVDDMRIVLVSRLLRVTDRQGGPEVRVIARRFGPP